jgi:hypothetical protein
MKTAVKSPESAVYRRGLGIFLTDSMALSGASRTKQTPSSRTKQTPSSQSKLLAVSSWSRRLLRRVRGAELQAAGDDGWDLDVARLLFLDTRSRSGSHEFSSYS